VLDGDNAPPPRKGADPQFSAHVYCGQTARCMKLVLGTEVGLSPGDFVLDEDLVPLPKKGRSPLPNFGPFLLWPNGSIHQDATWYWCWPQPRGPCVRWRPSLPSPTKKAEPPPNFRHISFVTKQLSRYRCITAIGYKCNRHGNPWRK